jgi:transcriptional regulator with XRE-family HTH domain
MSAKSPNLIDKHVGARVRMRRLMLDMTQEQLGKALGLTFQQVQKYENGMNRIGAARLHQLAGILQVPVAFFFENAGPTGEPLVGIRSDVLTPAQLNEFLTTNDGLALVKAFLQIENHEIRRCIVDLAAEIAARSVRR